MFPCLSVPGSEPRDCPDLPALESPYPRKSSVHCDCCRHDAYRAAWQINIEQACLLEYLLHIERNDQAYYALSLLLLFKAYMKKLSALNIVRPEVLWSCITPTPELLLETWGNQNFPKALFRQETPGQVRFHQSDLLLVPTSTKNGNRRGQHSRSAWDVVLLHRLPRVH